MPIDFKLNHEPFSEGKEARYAVCTGYEKKAYTHLIYCYGDTVILSFHAFFLPSFLQGPQIALTDRI